MMDHIMNNKLSLEFGESYVRIPLKKSPHIQHGDALEMDWARLIARAHARISSGIRHSEARSTKSPKQREQVRRVAHLGGSGGTLDYVTAWFHHRWRLPARIAGAGWIRGHELHHPGGAGGATLASSLRPLRASKSASLTGHSHGAATREARRTYTSWSLDFAGETWSRR